MSEPLTRTVGYYTTVDFNTIEKMLREKKIIGRRLLSLDEAREESHMENLRKLNKLADHFKECEE